MEDRAIERLTDLYDYWMPQVSDTTTYPIDCVFTADELETIDRYKPDFQNPVRELENYRGHRVIYRNVLIRQDTNLMGIEGRVLDMTLNIRPASSTMFTYFRMHVAKDGRCVTTVRYKPANNTVRIDRSHCGFPHDIVNVREFLVSPSNGVLKMRVILDRHSMELFINDGEQAASSLIYTHDGAQAISFEADGDVLLDVEKYSLNL